MSADEYRELLEWVRGRLPALIDDVYAEVVRTIPVYRGGEQVPSEELHHSIDDNLRFLVDALRRPELPPDLDVPKGTGRRRAHQGVPLPEVLRVYRIASATLWGRLVDHATHTVHHDTLSRLLVASTRIWDISNEHAAVLTDAYRAAMSELIVVQEHRRAALVEVLLTGHVGKDAGPWEAASLLGFAPGAELMVVAAQTDELATESLPGIERALAAQGHVSGWRLTPSLQLGVVAVPSGAADAVTGLLREHAKARVGVSPVYRSPGDTPRALRLARAALRVIPRGRAEVRVFSASPIAALLAADPGESQRLAGEVLGPVLRLPDADRRVLLETLDAFFRSDGSAARASALLTCHPNTVRYRLRRVEELTGRTISHPSDAAEIASAVFATELAGDDAVTTS